MKSLVILSLTLSAVSNTEAQTIASKKEVLLNLSNQDLDRLTQSNFGIAHRMFEQGHRYQRRQQQQQQPNSSSESCISNTTTEEFTYSAQIEKTIFGAGPALYVNVPYMKLIQLNEVLDRDGRARDATLDSYSVLECSGHKQTTSYHWFSPSQRQQYSHPMLDEASYRHCLAMGGTEEKCHESALIYGSQNETSRAEIDCINRQKNRVPEYKLTACQIVRVDQQRLQALQQIQQFEQQQRIKQQQHGTEQD